MITNFFIPELNNHDVQELWFQQDDTKCHTARATIDLLKDVCRSSLAILHTSSTAQRNVDAILWLVIFSFRARNPGASFQTDNTRPQIIRISLDYLSAVNTLPWPASSPDLSPIAHVWYMVGYQIRAH
ncbi:transposable element Tc1 transposase [Trichonephila clavipes]|nr:transposable element Tc1 transposase [Trichonephila clavipes]